MIRRSNVRRAIGASIAGLAFLSVVALSSAPATASRGGSASLALKNAPAADTEAEREAAAAPTGPAQPDSGVASKHDVSRPLRDIPDTHAPPGGRAAESGDRADEQLPAPASNGQADPVVQVDSARAPQLAAPTPGVNVDGVGKGFVGPAGTFVVNSAPPDTNAAVGANHVVEVVNAAFAVFNKSGIPVLGPLATNTLWSGFGGKCETTNDGDGVVVYDNTANRWIITQFANATSSVGPFLECFAVSTSSDPTGTYNRYAFSFANFPDYPKVGVWPDAFYVTYNMFNPTGTSYLGAQACAMDRAAMLAGASASQECFMTSTAFGGLLPADLDGTTPPPIGEPNLLVGIGATNTTLATWKFHPDFVTPANATFVGPTSIGVAAFTEACNGGTCIPQKGVSQKLDSLADRLMFRNAYRNFGDHESFVFTHSVKTSSFPSGVRWYELRLNGSGNPTVFQQSTYGVTGSARWMSSAAMDKSGNLAVGFSLSGTGNRPSVHFNGRLANDPINQLTLGEGTIIDGNGSQNGGLSRWGDYSSMSVDPVDGCTFWYANEYLPATGSFNWRTRLASFSLPGCGSVQPNDFSIAANPTTVTVNAGSSGGTTISTAVVSGSPESIALSASGLPAGATASFSPPTVTAGNSSTMTIQTSSSTPAGTSSVTVTGTAASATHSTTVGLTVNAVVAGGIVNGDFESGAFNGWTRTGTSSITNSNPHSGSFAAMLGSSSPSALSTLVQTFTAPNGASQLSVFYLVACNDTVSNDFAAIRVKDNTTGTTTTILPNTCTNDGIWTQVTTSVVAGHSYTLTLANKDNGAAGTATFTKFDDITLS